MNTNDIVPDVLDEAPTDSLKVIYPGELSVDLGNELTPTQVKDQPIVNWEADENALYALLMVDPDAPSRDDPKFREILHWSVINIPGNNLSAGQTIAEYIGSGPPLGTGLHRYIFLLYKQSGKIEEDLHIDKTTRTGRLNFNTREYMIKYNLGAVIAGNYYQAQYDDYVRIRNEQLGRS